MKVLITGGAGYIGSHCNKYFGKQGIDTVVLDNMLFGHEEAVVCGKLIKGEIGDARLLDKIFEEEEIEAVIHFAALADVADSVTYPDKYYDVNVRQMIVLLDAMVRHNVKYIVFSSSAATFGEPQYVPIDETHSQNPINPYGMTKLIGEKMLADYERAYGIRYCAMRYFNAAGASNDCTIGESHDPEHHILPLIFQTALGTRKKFYIFGNDYDTKDGTCIRDYVHVEDLASAHYLALKYLIDNNNSECFNLGNNEGYSVLEVIKNFEHISGMKLNYEFAERRAGDPAKLVATNDKARNILKWKPENSKLINIMKTAWNWEAKKTF